MSYTDLDRIRDLCDKLKFGVSHNPNMRENYRIWKEMEQPLKRLIKFFDKIKKEKWWCELRIINLDTMKEIKPKKIEKKNGFLIVKL